LYETQFEKCPFLDSMVKETMRLHLPRENREACVINAYEIHAKIKVIINAWAVGRDPVYWNEAKRFVRERFVESFYDFGGRLFEYTPFGMEGKFVLELHFSLPNMLLSLPIFLYHFVWKLATSQTK